MPKGFTVHFRYKKKYVSNDILENQKKYIGKELLIFFTDINRETNKVKGNYAIRSSTLKLIETTEETELVHIYFQLGNFVDATISETNSTNELPSVKYLNELDCVISKPNESWINKISLIKSFFSDFSFFHLKSLKSIDGKVVDVKSSANKKSSHYKISQGRKYLLDISLANPNEKKCQIAIESSSTDVSFNTTNPISINAHFDDQTVPMYAKSLNVSSESSFMSFFPVVDKESEFKDLSVTEYACNIELEKSIGWWKAIKFGIATVLAVLSIWMIKDNSKYLNEFSTDLPLEWRLIVPCVILILMSSYLFLRFNKK
ncbi:hypothetical protein BTO16_11620 [Polaribacter glomeratus]|uniref:Uncharacterized protein n=2 Tax=Polaribacter glomeratus TaxID=102 RepID=A0A2S7WG10_9FLAO|nr:hypothetical protein BTO16_11620 [Polaribacter glomeratus]